jgi:hypothetical protein
MTHDSQIRSGQGIALIAHTVFAACRRTTICRRRDITTPQLPHSQPNDIPLFCGIFYSSLILISLYGNVLQCACLFLSSCSLHALAFAVRCTCISCPLFFHLLANIDLSCGQHHAAVSLPLRKPCCLAHAHTHSILEIPCRSYQSHHTLY